MSKPYDVCVMPDGNIYIADLNNNRIRKVDTAGIITTFAGTGTAGYSGDGRSATAADLNQPYGVCGDAHGNIYIADRGNYVIRMVDPSGIIFTVAGDGTRGYRGDGHPATDGEFKDPVGVAVDISGNIYIADAGDHRIRMVDASGTMSTICGGGVPGSSGDGGPATTARINTPVSVSADLSGNVYIADSGNQKIRVIDASGIISTFAGIGTSGFSGDGGYATAASLSSPVGVVTDIFGNVLIADAGNNRIRLVNPSGIISTLAGTGAPAYGGDGGYATSAQINMPTKIVMDNVGNMFIADASNDRIRKLPCITPFINTTTGSAQVCLGGTTTLSNTTSGGTWSVFDASIATVSATGLVTGVALGTDTIYYSLTNACGTSSMPFVISVITTPVAGTISGATSVCVGASATYTSSVSGGYWTLSNTNASLSGASVTGVTAGLDTVKYLVVNICGFDIASQPVTINPLPDAGSITGAGSVCVGGAITLTDGITGGVWSATNSNATVSGGVVTGVSAGTDTILYAVTNMCGTDTVSHTIVINPLPVPGTITGSSSVCVGATITLTDTASGGAWSTITGNATVTGGVVTGVSGGADTIVYTVTNSCGTLTATHAITINPLANPGTISGVSSLCVGSSAILTETVTGGVWSGTNATATVSDSMVTGAAAGTDTVLYSVTNGCGTTTAMHIINIVTAPHAGPIAGSHGVCLGSRIVLTVPTVGGTWSAINANASITADTVTGVTAGRDTLAYIVTNACGADTAHFIVSVDTVAPVVSAIAGPYIVCVNDTIRLTDSVSGGVWTSMNTSIATINSTGRVRGVSAGLDTVIYHLTNGCGADTASYVVTVNPLPVAGTITGYDSVCIGSTITLHTSGTGGTWISGSPDFGAVDATGHVTGLLNGSTIITYEVSNSCGTADAYHTVNVNSPAQPIIGSEIICQSSFTSPTPSIFFDAVPFGTWSSSNLLVALVIPGGTGAVLGITLGTATITYTVHNACGTTIATLDVEVVDCSTLGVEETKTQAPSIELAPNPNSGTFTINLLSGTSEKVPVVIRDVLGRKVKELTVATNTPTEVDFDVPAGVYVVSAVTKSGRIEQKVVRD